MQDTFGKSLKDKVVLITGGAGSLGRALAAELHAKSIRIFDNSEHSLWEMQQDFPDMRFLVGDIRDKDRLHRAFNGVDYVIHCAALKHVPFCEYNPIEAVKTNVIGTINVIDAAIDNGVSKVLAISSDKAVEPINLYGATKLVMEKTVIGANVYVGTKFSCVRSGNFWGSKGSLGQIIEDKLKNGSKLLLTDTEMDRYWIPLDEISQFIIKCIELMDGGEIFVPKMSRSLVVDVMKSYGVEYEVVGKRNGEKLHEILFAEGENPTDCGEYYLIRG